MLSYFPCVSYDSWVFNLTLIGSCSTSPGHENEALYETLAYKPSRRSEKCSRRCGKFCVLCFHTQSNVNNHLQFKQRYKKLTSHTAIPVHVKKGRPAASNMKALLRELDLSDEYSASDDAGSLAAPTDPTKPWLKDFDHYLNTVDELSEGQTIVQWWGVSSFVFSLQTSSESD
jgi:hypothetical protein